ncbi:MAG: hypothetical protein LUC34_03800 [Campylobacter sp.]|nr:hypothetical protein [Campylobacter sp.]
MEELKMLQEIIKRMAENSFKIKAWTITLIVTAIIFRGKIENSLIALIPLVAFFVLDTYYLTMERNFKKIYNNKVDKFHKGDFGDIFKFKIDNANIVYDMINASKSASIWLFYGGICLLGFFV